MLALAAIIHLFVGAVFSGLGVVVALLAGQAATGLAIGALIGFLVSFPVTYWVARALWVQQPEA